MRWDNLEDTKKSKRNISTCWHWHTTNNKKWRFITEQRDESAQTAGHHPRDELKGMINMETKGICKNRRQSQIPHSKPLQLTDNTNSKMKKISKENNLTAMTQFAKRQDKEDRTWLCLYNIVSSSQEEDVHGRVLFECKCKIEFVTLARKKQILRLT